MHDAFLQTLAATPHDDVSRLVYADWLTDQDDPAARLQAEYLRLTVEGAPPARLQPLAAQLDPAWLAVVSRLPIEHCGREQPAVPFRFVCDRNWQDLAPTGDATIRHCGGCQKDVHYCATSRDARSHASSGHCIAVDLGILRHEGDVPPPENPDDMVMGMMEPDWEATATQLALDPVSAAREQSRYDRERDLRNIARREERFQLRPFEALDLGAWQGVTRLHDCEANTVLTCFWGRGLHIELAARSSVCRTWVPAWFVPRPLRTWANVEATLAEAPAHVWDTAYQTHWFADSILGGPTWYHQVRTRERTDLVVWRSFLPKPGPGVLRCLDAYRQLRKVAWWCTWLWGSSRRLL
jgi:uncharacterized protein (TIGR02996 family)